MKKKIAVLSISGGLDSTCLLLKLLAEDYLIVAYTFDYGQKHVVEQEKLKVNINFLKSKGYLISLQSIDLKACFSDSQSSLHVNGEDIPEGDYEEENMKSTVVENRNVIFASIIYGKALSLAKLHKDHIDIFLGVHAGDHAIYPDTTEESRMACAHAFNVSNWGSENISYKAPFIDIDKSQVLAAGIDAMEALHLDTETALSILKNTHSCYNPNKEGKACGKCGTCKERLLAFWENGMIDPGEYQ